MAKPTVSLSDPLVKPSQEFYQNPYPVLKRLQQEAPVFWSEKGKYWLVTHYADAHAMLGDLHFEKGIQRWRQHSILAKLLQRGPMSSFGSRSMLNQNPPDHTRLRSLVNKAFTPSMINQMRSHIESIANELLDAVVKNGKMDLIADFAFPLPAIVIAEMLGIPAEDRIRFKTWSHTLTAALDPSGPNPIDLARVMHAYKELTSYLTPLIEQRRASRKSDLISALVEAEEEGNRLTQAELLNNTVLLLIAGHETTMNLIGNGMYALLRNPQQFDLLKTNPDILPSAVQEFLRYDSPVQMVRRTASQDLQVGDQPVLSGQDVLILIGAVNRDPSEFEDPDTLNIQRSKNRHLAFGHGIHHCLGSSLASMEGEIALRCLLTRTPNMILESKDPQYKHPFSLRGLKELHVRF